MTETATDTLLRTPLHGLHGELGARLVPFAGYEMPVQYPAGIMKEHLHTRAAAGLFDVSHMGQVRITGPNAAAALERLVPGDIQALKPGRLRYSFFTNDQGGILDDLIVTKVSDTALFLVVNGACKVADLAHMRAHLTDVEVEYLGDDHGLLALQGPSAAAVLDRLVPGVAAIPFMSAMDGTWQGVPLGISRSGYTGEDGFEISVPGPQAEALARALLAQPEVAPVGLGARDSLRLEAGLCLYGHDLDETTSPIEAGLGWAISKRRREAGGFPGDHNIKAQLSCGTARTRVGLLPEGRAPAREGTEIQAPDGQTIGRVTSGGFGPSLNGPLAMGYVASAYAAPGTPVHLMVRGKPLPAQVAAMPFVPHRYVKG